VLSLICMSSQFKHRVGGPGPWSQVLRGPQKAASNDAGFCDQMPRHSAFLCSLANFEKGGDVEAAGQLTR
jgi:hypothetical protein